MTVEISIVVCTRNRAARLASALKYYPRLRTAASWELVAVNNGSTDETAGVLADFAGSSGLRVKVVDELRAGASAGRNTGWRTAAGEVVAFTDDDCYPAEDYVERLRECFADRDLGYVGGRILLFDRNDYPV